MTDFVSRDELSAHLDPMREDIREIKGDVKTILQARYEGSFLGGRGHMLLVACVPAVLTAAVALVIALLIS